MSKFDLGMSKSANPVNSFIDEEPAPEQNQSKQDEEPIKKEVKNARITFLTTTEKMAQLQNIINQQMANYTYGTEKPTINKLLNTAVDEYLKNHQ